MKKKFLLQISFVILILLVITSIVVNRFSSTLFNSFLISSLLFLSRRILLYVWICQNRSLFFLALAFFYLGIALSFSLKSDVSPGNFDKQNPGAIVRDTPHSPFNDLDGNQNYLNTFFYIFVQNSAVGAVLSIGGLLSAGIMAAVLMVWNGYLLGVTVNAVFSQGLTIYEFILTFLIHGPIEILAMAWLGAIGLRGSLMLRDLVQKNTIGSDLIPCPWETGAPFVFLGIAAFLETAVIYYLES